MGVTPRVRIRNLVGAGKRLERHDCHGAIVAADMAMLKAVAPITPAWQGRQVPVMFLSDSGFVGAV